MAVPAIVKILGALSGGGGGSALDRYTYAESPGMESVGGGNPYAGVGQQGGLPQGGGGVQMQGDVESEPLFQDSGGGGGGGLLGALGGGGGGGEAAGAAAAGDAGADPAAAEAGEPGAEGGDPAGKKKGKSPLGGLGRRGGNTAGLNAYANAMDPGAVSLGGQGTGGVGTPAVAGAPIGGGGMAGANAQQGGAGGGPPPGVLATLTDVLFGRGNAASALVQGGVGGFLQNVLNNNPYNDFVDNGGLLGMVQRSLGFGGEGGQAQ